MTMLPLHAPETPPGTVDASGNHRSREPMITVELKGQTSVKYADLDEEKTRTIYEGHVLSRNVAEEPALAIGSERVG